MLSIIVSPSHEKKIIFATSNSFNLLRCHKYIVSDGAEWNKILYCSGYEVFFEILFIHKHQLYSNKIDCNNGKTIENKVQFNLTILVCKWIYIRNSLRLCMHSNIFELFTHCVDRRHMHHIQISNHLVSYLLLCYRIGST